MKLRIDRKPQPLREYLESNAFVGGVIQLVVAALLAGLAIGRADGHVLSARELAALVGGSALGGALVGWPVGLYAGAADTLAGWVLVARSDRADRTEDDFATRRLWTTATAWAVAAGVWALAGASLVAVVLDGREAGTLLVAASLFALGGVAGRAVDLVARRRGIDIARSHATSEPPAPVTVRRRAWLDIALPLAAGQLVVNSAFAWLLFHDYDIGDAFAARPLTDSEALADVGVVVIIVTLLFGSLARQWGAVDAALGRVDSRGLEPASSAIGVQGLVYAAGAAIVVGRLAGFLLPSLPDLARVAVVRGAFAGLVAFVVCGLAYVRGAANVRLAGVAS